MRGLLKFFALLSFIGDCVSALGTVYPQWETAYTRYKERKEALKTPEERAQEAEAAAEELRKKDPNYKPPGTMHVNDTVDVQYEDVSERNKAI